MSADNLKAIGTAAGLNPEQQKKVDSFRKSLEAHKNLSNLPSDTANRAYNSQFTANQKADLVKNFGNEDPTVKPNRGWLGTAWHYTGGAVGNALGYAGSHVLAGLGNVSDFTTRVWRTGQIAGEQGVDLNTAWTIANDKGDKVFSPSRINDAKIKFGNDAVEVAQRIAAGESNGEIFASATPEQKKFVMLADPTNKQIQGIADDQVEAARGLFQDTLDAVNAAKYSPGRFVANLVTPAELEGSGLYYKAVSGAVDAAYRVLADPLLIAGKAKRLYDVRKYALDVVLGGKKVDQYFANPNTVNFWNQYGSKLDELTKAQKAKNPEAILKAKTDLRIMAPEFGDEVIKSFQKADGGGIIDAATAKGFFENTKQVDEMIKGGVGRQRVILPVLDNQRKLRIAAVTTGRKVFNIDSVGPKLVDDMWFGGSTDSDGIARTIIDGQEVITNKVTAATNFKGISRFSMKYINSRIDRAKAAFSLHPMFPEDVFDVTAPDAADKMYRLAILVMPKRESQLFKEAFNSIEEVGTRKEMYYGLWKTIAEIRGMNTTLPGQAITRNLTGKTTSVHSVSNSADDFAHIGSMPSDMSNFVSAPSLTDLDRAASRNGLFQKMMGIANSEFANRMTGAWSFLTLAGPRYAIRNATEDLMVNLAIGESIWGIGKARMLSTRLNTVMTGVKKADGTISWSDNPLGSVLRLVNRKDSERYAAELSYIDNVVAGGKAKLRTLNTELKAATDDATKAAIKKEIADIQNEIRGGTVGLTRQVFARALTEGKLNRVRAKLGMKPVNEEEANLLAEQIIHGNIDEILADVSEGGMNFATGNDYVKSAMEFAKKTGVRNHNLVITYPDQKLVKKPGERGYKRQGVSVQDEASLVAWMMRIGYFADDKLGAIAVANLDDEVTAINLMKKWVNETKAGQKFIKDAQLAAKEAGGIDTLIALTFKRAKENFIKSGDNTLNVDLLNKIRIKDENGLWKVSGKLSLDDLPTNELDVPAAIVGPTLIPAVELEQQTQAVMTKGWTWLGLSNARMSRQPIVLEEMIRIRKQMRNTGFEDAWIQSYIKGIDPDNAGGIAAATARAKRDLATVVEERALNQTLAYVDNPLVRTQVAFASRNFARFYRATEDFYRRMYRVVRYNPEALVKAALTYEGITHSGWVQKDDQGNDYFVYPGLGPVYNAIETTLDRMGIGDEFKVPFPVQFGAQMKMVTPSLNPDSLVPTFSGPVAGLSVGTISSLVNIFDKGAADTIKGTVLGKYSVDQPFLSMFLPAHINRLYAAMNPDERNSQYASAYRKAVTYLEASGNGIPKHYDKDGNLVPPTAQELEDYRLAAKNTTIGILGMRFAFGFFAPASPQVQLKSDMAEWVRDNGSMNFKQAWQSLLTQYPGDYDGAMAKWVELFPNQIPFTLAESERKGLAPLRYAQESGEFVNQNETLFKDHPLAASFLIPHKTGFSWDAYKSMKDLGLTQNKRVEDYLREVQTASDLQTYYERKNQYEASLENAGADFERTLLRQEFDSWKKVFFAGRPLVQEELSQGSEKAIKRLNTLDDLSNLLSKNLGVRPKTEERLRLMLNTYQNYQNLRTQYTSFGGSQEILKMEKENVIVQLRQLSDYNENTRAAYDVLFGRLLGD